MRYNASWPQLVTRTWDLNTSQYIYTAADGPLRVWSKNGNWSRSVSPVSFGGDFVAPEDPFRVQDVSYQELPGYRSIDLYVESIRPSKDPGDQRIILEAGVLQDGTYCYTPLDAVRFTSLESRLVEIKENNSIAPATTIQTSYPTPVINIANCTVSGLGASSDYQTILGTLQLGGTVQSALADLDPSGAVSEVRVYVNSYDTPVAVVSLAGVKSTNAASYVHPFPFTGNFQTNLTDIEFEPGLNLVRITATHDDYTGYAEMLVNVNATRTNSMLERYSDARVSLDFGSITSLAALTPTTPVPIAFTNRAAGLASLGSLYKVSDSPLVLSNASAWVTILDGAQLDAALGSSGAASFAASVSVPALAPLDIAFTFESLTNDGKFSFRQTELELTASGAFDGTVPDSITAKVRHADSAWQTATLSNSSGATNVYTGAAGTFGITVPTFPFLTNTLADSFAVTVSHSGIGLSARTVFLNETNESSRVFVTDDELEFLEDYSGYTFSADAATAGEKSNGGVSTYYGWEIDGPAPLLDRLQQVDTSSDGTTVNWGVAQASGKRLLNSLFSNHYAPATMMWLTKGASLLLPTSQGNFERGFAKGFWEGGVSLVHAGVTLLKYNQPIYLGYRFHNDRFAPEIKKLLQTHSTITDLLSYWIHWRANQIGDIMSSANPFAAALKAKSEDFRFLAETFGGAIIALEILDSQATDYERGKLHGRVAFELSTLIISEIKALQAGLITRISKLSLLRTAEARFRGLSFAGADKAADSAKALAQYINPKLQGVTVLGTAWGPRMKWTPNPPGVTRTLDEMVALAKGHGVQIPDDVRFIEVLPSELPPPKFKGDAVYATYFRAPERPGNVPVQWREFYGLDGKIPVRVSREILTSDEAAAAVIAHEMHELNALRVYFREAGGQMPTGRLYNLVNADNGGPLHLEAWDVADRVVLRMRSN